MPRRPAPVVPEPPRHPLPMKMLSQLSSWARNPSRLEPLELPGRLSWPTHEFNKLERVADHMLGLHLHYRLDEEYPVLSDDQLSRRRADEYELLRGLRTVSAPLSR